MRRWVGIGVTLLIAVTAEPAMAEDALIERGRTIAQTQCTRCHVVGDFNRMGGISSTPSFQIMVNSIADWKERFDTFYARPPHAAIVRFDGEPPDKAHPPATIEILIALEDVPAITAFARTLGE